MLVGRQGTARKEGAKCRTCEVLSLHLFVERGRDWREQSHECEGRSQWSMANDAVGRLEHG